MNKNKGKRIAAKVIVTVSVIVVIAVGGFLLLRNIGKNALSNRIDDKITEIGGSGNVEALKRLNDEWTLPEEYTFVSLPCSIFSIIHGGLLGGGFFFAILGPL